MTNLCNKKKKVIPSIQRPPPTSTAENNSIATTFDRRKLRDRKERVLIIDPPKDAIMMNKRSVESFGIPMRETGSLPDGNDAIYVVEDACELAMQKLRMNVSRIISEVFEQCAKAGKKTLHAEDVQHVLPSRCFRKVYGFDQ
ncbi:unnamed protein product [Angiostrongylus costaricensis]|uniref:CBFD_NFYB_HMF domain-containing protein n=1 Tax=Angiostrongylus costaricensis TaxID=334426 RepID=A0A0R3PEJ3_ANGCS|nr:unnamed protein product [Angiostrongylus costaricensis]